MKLKQYPRDFIVEEISSIVPSTDKDTHTIFLLEKEEMDTFEALRYISNKWQIPIHEIGYAGLKDKHALTKQWISVPTRNDLKSFRKNRIRTQFIGYCNNKIRIGELFGNRFIITARAIKKNQINPIQKRIDEIEETGVLNYFDSQRFGSVIKQNFIAKAILQGEIEIAIKWFLTLYQKSESRYIKNDKRLILTNWPNLSTLSIKEYRLRIVIDEYLKTQDWLESYKKIPVRLRELIKNAYQSYLWNECIKHIVSKLVNPEELLSVKYAAGELLFFKDISSDVLLNLPQEFPTICYDMHLSDEESSVINEIITQENISFKDFKNYEKTGTYFSTQLRKVVVTPKNLRKSSFDLDMVNSIGNQSCFKIELAFELPKGSYATIVTKSIFGH